MRKKNVNIGYRSLATGLVLQCDGFFLNHAQMELQKISLNVQ